jgi:hypothetical protein
MVVLRPGLEGNRALGTHAQPGLYVRFQGGTVDVKDEKIITLLREHPAFNTDFIEVAETMQDPYDYTRSEIEPAHVLTEIKYGHVEKVTGTPKNTKMSPELKKLIEMEAMKMLPGMLKANPKILKEIIMGLASDMKKDEPEEVVKEAPAKKVEEKIEWNKQTKTEKTDTK